MPVRAVAVYCGSSMGNDARHAATAAELGAALAAHGIELVYGGGHVGLMGVLDPTGFFDPLIAFVDRAVAEGFVAPANRELITTYGSIDALLDGFAVA